MFLVKNLRRMYCNDPDILPFTKSPKNDKRIKNQMVSNNIHDQGETGICWDFAISSMLRGSLRLFISQLDAKLFSQTQIEAAEKKLNNEDHHRQLRNEIITGPIPKNLSKNFIDLQGHSVKFACERVMQFNTILKSHLELQLINPTAFDEIGILMLDSIREIFDILGIPYESMRYNIEEYNLKNDINKLEAELERKKSFVVGLDYQLVSSSRGKHAMVATGIKRDKTGLTIELKDSYADDPDPGKVRHKQLISSIAAIDYGSHPMIHSGSRNFR